ncbi:MAG: hypothetical protein AAFY56_07155 [Pseudomonadota bacterium]
MLPANVDTKHKVPARSDAASSSPNSDEALLIELAVHEETIAELRKELGRLMARVDEEVLIHAELRDQVWARDAEIQRLQRPRWWHFWSRWNQDEDRRSQEDDEEELGEASLADMTRL